MDPNSPTAFDTYLRDLADCHVMSPEVERASAERIANARLDRWMAILAQPSYLPGILALAHQQLGDKLDPNLVKRAMKAAEARRRSRKRNELEAYREAAQALALHVISLDKDQVLADTIAADLDAIDGGRKEGTSLDIDLPRGRDATFRRYVQRVRKTSQAFWSARSSFARANLRLVVSMARRVGRGRMSLADLVQEGNIGLMQAIDRFDHTRGFRFSTYGAWWIRHAMNRALQNKAREIRLPVHVLDALHRLNRARREYETKHGRPAPIEYLAEVTEMSEAKIAKLERHYLVSEYPASLDEPTGNEDRDRSETITKEDELRRSDLPDRGRVDPAIEQAPADPPAMHRNILREIGEHYSLSRERIRQLQERALGRIRGELQEQRYL